MNGHKIYFTIKYFNGVYLPVNRESLDLFYQVLTLVRDRPGWRIAKL